MKKLNRKEINLRKATLKVLEAGQEKILDTGLEMLNELVGRYPTQDAAFEAIGRKHKTGVWKAMKFKRKGGKVGSADIKTLAKWCRMFLEIEK